MSYFRHLRHLFSFKVIITTLLLWLLISTQSMAWQNSYSPYYGYAPVTQTAYPAYTRPAYSPRQPAAHAPAYRFTPASYTVTAPTVKRTPVERIDAPGTMVETAKRKIKQAGEKVLTKKQEFINKLLPYIQKENARIQQIRSKAADLIDDLNRGYSIPDSAKQWLKDLAKKYRISKDPVEHQAAREEILQRVDIIPASLTLAQAANESAWGKSRFATEANNLYGIWTYDKSNGLIPKNRDSGKKHLVRKFDDLGDSIQYYMLMLNSHPAYEPLREVRAEARNNNQSPDGVAMAAGLEKYSARGQTYIKLIRDLIHQNEWAKLDNNSPSA